MFSNCGIIHFEKNKIEEEEIFEIAINAGAIIQTLDGKPFLYGKEDYKNQSLLIRRSKNLND